MAPMTTPSPFSQVLRPERVSRGDTGVHILQPIDEAAWLWMPGLPPAPPREGVFLRFRRRFETVAGEETLRLDVSADERFVLLLDGVDFARGPHRGTPDRWLYQSYDIRLTPGFHTLEAVVWQLGDAAPLAQLTMRGGFILHAEGAYNDVLTTGKAAWEVARLGGTRAEGGDRGGSFGVGLPVTVRGTSFLREAPPDDAYAAAEVVVKPLWEPNRWGIRTRGWLLFPTTLPDQTHTPCVPGVVREGPGAGAAPAPFTVPPRSKAVVLWDLGDYYCAYPELGVSGGAGAVVRWGWAESLRGDDGLKVHRDEWRGRSFFGFTDEFRPDGRAGAHFTTPWWRCGRWCRIEIETADDPLAVARISLDESRYPMEAEASFACDDASLGAVQRICLRGMQMCAHEMFFDCPYYEQQMYPGDTRVQLLTVGAIHADDRLIRHAIQLFDLSRRDNGMVGMNFPTRGTQESATYTAIWPLMFRDYLRWHADAGWLRARAPGLHHTLHGLAFHENADGLLENLPGWSFMDWVPEWDSSRGVAPSGGPGEGVSALNNLLYLHALQSVADVDEALGEPRFAAAWRDRADRVARAILDAFWCEERGMVADDASKTAFSEHAQCLALLAGILDGDRRERAWKGLLEAPDLARTTVYFSHYLFETYFLFGRADLFLKRLDLWRRYVAMGLRTPLEAPDGGKNGQCEARSDCHAWGSHPLYHLHAGVAGVRPAAPFFGAVRIAPCPGPLSFIRSTTPTPHGPVALDLAFEQGRVRGTVTLPDGLPGTFSWQGRDIALQAGANDIAM